MDFQFFTLYSNLQMQQFLSVDKRLSNLVEMARWKERRILGRGDWVNIP